MNLPSKRTPLRFFLPDVPAEEAESNLSMLVAQCEFKVPVPAPADRIYSIVFDHDSVEWTATVGERLRGVKHTTTRRRGVSETKTSYEGDPGTVLAIVPGPVFQIVHDLGVREGRRSMWHNPALAGQPTSITYFTADDGTPTT